MRWKNLHDASKNVIPVLKETMDSYYKTFGRRYGNGLIEPYKMEGAEAAIIAMGSIAGSAKSAVDKLQADGKKVGLLKLRCFIPFPEEDFVEWGKKVKAISVIDRSICPGKGGPVFGKLRDSLYDEEERPKVLQFHAGLGGKEVRVTDVVNVGEKTLKVAQGGKVENLVTWV